jgi:voltage-gated potassium channel
MFVVLGATFAGVLLLGALYGYTASVGPWDGMYFAVVTVTTVGYGDIIPHGWAAHLVALAIMVLIVPLWSGSFSLFATGLITRDAEKRHEDQQKQADRRHDELKKHVTDRTGTAS